MKNNDQGHQEQRAKTGEALLRQASLGLEYDRGSINAPTNTTLQQSQPMYVLVKAISPIRNLSTDQMQEAQRCKIF